MNGNMYTSIEQRVIKFPCKQSLPSYISKGLIKDFITRSLYNCDLKCTLFCKFRKILRKEITRHICLC